MVEERGQNSNRNTIDQTAENDQNISGGQDLDTQRCITGAGHQEFEAAERSLTAHIRFTTGGRLQSDSGWSWTIRIACVTLHDCEVALMEHLEICHTLTIIMRSRKSPNFYGNHFSTRAGRPRHFTEWQAITKPVDHYVLSLLLQRAFRATLNELLFETGINNDRELVCSFFFAQRTLTKKWAASTLSDWSSNPP